MSSKEEKKSKGSKTEASSSGADTPKKKDSVDVLPETKGKGKREKPVRANVPVGTSMKLGTRSGNLQRLGLQRETKYSSERYGDTSGPKRLSSSNLRFLNSHCNFTDFVFSRSRRY